MSIYIAVPYTRPFYGAFIDSLIFSKKPDTFLWQRLPFMGVDVARNALMKWYLMDDRRPDYILFIDNDATWSAEAITRLVSHDLPMVCGCMYTKDLPPSPTWGKFLGQNRDGKLIYRYAESAQRIIRKMRVNGYTHENIETNSLTLPPTKDDLWEIDGCGFHFTLVRRDVAEALREPYFLDENGNGAGEDFYFCRKVREAGFPIYVDESVQTGHLLGEDRDFGIRELMAWAQHVSDQELETEIADTVGNWEV